MAETIAESLAYVDSIAEEHTDPSAGGMAAPGAEAAAATLDIDFAELYRATWEDIPDSPLKPFLHAMVLPGFLYGTRYEQQRGAREELTMIALALKNVGLPELDDEQVTPERGVEILIEQLVRLRRG